MIGIGRVFGLLFQFGQSYETMDKALGHAPCSQECGVLNGAVLQGAMIYLGEL